MKGDTGLLCLSDECLSTLVLPLLGIVDRIKLSVTCKRLHSLSAQTPLGHVTLKVDDLEHCFDSDCSTGKSRSMLHVILQAAKVNVQIDITEGDLSVATVRSSSGHPMIVP
jgi:hypothetical protein